MGCLSNRKKQTGEFSDQKWDHINLDDFKAVGCGTGFAYFYLWLMLIISVAVYAVDTFTAYQLVAFDRWSSEIEPAISFDVSKWIFVICIILSFVNLGFEGIRATRIIKRGNVAESYLDSLAVRWQSIRIGGGQGWRRFLVFAELTKSKKGAEYIALFTYFSFKSWIRVLVCSGPRQVVNAFTLRSVFVAKLQDNSSSVDASIAGFFDNIRRLAVEDYRQVVILGGMAFTLVVWIFSFLFLLAAVLFYVFFLFHWIPRADGGLSGYCERKVNQTLVKIVTQKVNKALAKGQYQRMKAEVKAAQKNGEKPPLERTATLPTLPVIGLVQEDKLPQMPMLGRNDTTTTLPPYTSRPQTPSNIELNTMPQARPGPPSRSGTSTTYSSRAPLISQAADMGYDRSASPAPSLPDFSGAMPPRPGTAQSQRSMGGPRPRVPHMQNGSVSSVHGNSPRYAESNVSLAQPLSPSAQSSVSYQSYGQDRVLRANTAQRQYDAYNPGGSAMSGASYGSAPAMPRQQGPFTRSPPTMRSATAPISPQGPQPPQRVMTAPIEHGQPGYGRVGTPQSMRRPGPPPDYNRPGTSQSQRGPPPYGYDVESQRDRSY